MDVAQAALYFFLAVLIVPQLGARGISRLWTRYTRTNTGGIEIRSASRLIMFIGLLGAALSMPFVAYAEWQAGTKHAVVIAISAVLLVLLVGISATIVDWKHFPCGIIAVVEKGTIKDGKPGKARVLSANADSEWIIKKQFFLVSYIITGDVTYPRYSGFLLRSGTRPGAFNLPGFFFGPISVEELQSVFFGSRPAL